jgi:hypothetical protein
MNDEYVPHVANGLLGLFGLAERFDVVAGVTDAQKK